MTRIRVKLQDVAEAMAMGNQDTRCWIDLRTGGVEFGLRGELDPDGDPDAADDGMPEWDQRIDVPGLLPREGWSIMERFAQDQDDDLRDELLRAIEGKGAFRRFHMLLDRWPGDARERWLEFRQEAHLELARRWLSVLDLDLEIIEPPKVARAPEPVPEPPKPARVGLIDLILLGAPDGRTEILNGRVARLCHAASTAQARKVFADVARDMHEMSGLAWRKHFIEGKSTIEVGRYHLELEGQDVWLEVAVEPGVYDRFSGG